MKKTLLVLAFAIFTAFCPSMVKGQDLLVTPTMSNVTVIDGNADSISWKLLLTSEIEGFLVERWEYYSENYTESAWKVIDTIADTLSRSYVDRTTSPDLKKRIYRLKTFNSLAQSFPSQEVWTIWLDSVIGYDPCSATDTLRWSAFSDVFSPAYRLYFRENGSAWDSVMILNPQVVDSVDTYETTAHDVFTPVLQYVHHVTPGASYQYKIGALFSLYLQPQQTSFSNIRTKTTYVYETPPSPVMVTATVNEDNSVSVCGSLGNSDIDTLLLYRDNALVSVSPVNGQTEICLTDTTASVATTPYNFRINFMDLCGRFIENNIVLNNIVLSGVTENMLVHLAWSDAVQGWPVDHYVIYRRAVDEADFTVIGTSSERSLDDDIGQVADPVSKYVYRVEMVGIDGQSAFSNCATLVFDIPDFLMPNAFIIGGRTPLFGPMFRVFPNTGFVFRVFNQWGVKLFETYDVGGKWNGYYDGKAVETGTCFWVVSYIDSDGERIQREGSVMVFQR